MLGEEKNRSENERGGGRRNKDQEDDAGVAAKRRDEKEKAPFFYRVSLNVHLGETCSLPSARQIRQKASVKQTKAQFHSWFFPTVDTPMKMKIRVSLTLLSIFMKYLMVV